MMKRLFILDDDTEILLSLEIWFQKKGLTVEVFALTDLLLSALENTKPGLILIDVNLRNRDGREICRELKQNHKVDCPIILYSGNPLSLTNYKDFLADDVIEKPFSLKDITRVITSYIQTH